MSPAHFWKSTAAALALVVTIGVEPTWAAKRHRVYVRIGPPAPIVEARVVAPGPNYVWVPGGWHRPPRVRAAWVPGHWARERRGWFFVQGHWR